MNHKLSSILIPVLFALLIGAGGATAQFTAPEVPDEPLGTAFTYQGRLDDDGTWADGTYDFRFILYDAATGGSQVGSTINKDDLAIDRGYFTVVLDFGISAFNGQARWLEVAVRPGDSTGEYTILSPRQALTAAPYSIFSQGAPWSGLSGVPAGFADNLDNDTIYSAGIGLTLSGTEFSVSFGGDGSANSVAHSDHNHLGEIWVGNENPLVMSGTFTTPPYYAPLVVGSDNVGLRSNSTWTGFIAENGTGWGLFVGDTYSFGVQATGSSYSGLFYGFLYASSGCFGCSQLVFGLNVSDQLLHPGQVVYIQGMHTATLDNALDLWEVVPAGIGQVAIGVVGGRAELDNSSPNGPNLTSETETRLVPREGPAGPGEYLSIVIYGPVQIQAGQEAASIQPGMLLMSGEDGLLRPLRTVTVDGIELAENAPTLGIALSTPDEKGLVWVLVNPR